MKKKLFLVLAIVAVMACIFAISVSADTIVPSTSNEYGTLTTFDEVIGNTNIAQTKDDGTVARTVLYDSTNKVYYTVPTTYVLTESAKGTGEMFLLSFGEIGTKLSTSFNKNSIIRLEFPSQIAFVCNGNENLSNCGELLEVKINNGLKFWDNSDQRKLFTNCKKLKSIDLSGMVMQYSKTTFAMFEYCESIESIVLPDAYFDGTKYLDYDTSHMFSGCKKLTHIENLDGFLKGDKTLNYKTYYNCYVLDEVYIADGVTTIEGRAIGNCSAITEIVIPDSVTVIGTTETVFESCTSLKTVVLPKKVALGNYCFEKCTGLTDIWMPTEASTFANQAFGQIGSSRAINFYFQTATNTVTYTGNDNKNDPYVTAINAENDARLKFNTPLSTKCTVFLGGHTVDIELSNACAIICEKCNVATVNHSEDAEVLVTVVYLDYTQAGKKITACQSVGCTHSVEQELEALITCKGYSAEIDNKNSKGIVVGYRINQAAITEYNKLTGKTVKYGIYAATKTALNGGDVFGEDGMPVDGAVKAEVNEGFVALEVKICGITNLDTEFAMGAYLEISNESEKEYAFIEDEKPLEGEKYYFVSYNSVATNN